MFLFILFDLQKNDYICNLIKSKDKYGFQPYLSENGTNEHFAKYDGIILLLLGLHHMQKRYFYEFNT